MFERIIVIVLDSAGCGGAADAAAFGDEGADTLGHIDAAVGLRLPNLRALGLDRVLGGRGEAGGAWGRLSSHSAGKDTTSGHWELCGTIVREAFPVFPQGFPAELMDAFTAAIGRGALGNKPASGTVILDELGPEHERTGWPIVYTSADSVFQIAAHEELVGLDALYDWCAKARALLVGPLAVGRVIARPFLGTAATGYRRTANRRDYSLVPAPGVLTQRLAEAGLAVIGVGKIEDIFAGVGITRAIHTSSNADGVAVTLRVMGEDTGRGLIFTNLVDFDSHYGHRNDVAGYAAALEAFDESVPELLAALRPDDLLVLTADHGNDPTWPGTDHTREQVPLLMAGAGISGLALGEHDFADLGQTIAANFGVAVPDGRSFLPSLTG